MEFKRGVRLWHCAHRKAVDMAVSLLASIHHKGIRLAYYFAVSFLCDWTGCVRVAHACGMCRQWLRWGATLG